MIAPPPRASVARPDPVRACARLLATAPLWVALALLVPALALAEDAPAAAGTPAPAPAAASASAATPAAPADAAPATAAAAPSVTPPAPAAAPPTPSVAAPATAVVSRARPSLLALAQPLWTDLKPRQREILAPLETRWNSLPAARKRAWVQLADRLPAMAPGERARALTRINEWAALTPEQRILARNNYRLAKTLPKDERVAQWEQYQQMTPEQRAVLRANGWTSNTAARHAGATNGLAKEVAKPLAATVPGARPTSGAAARPGTSPAGPVPAGTAPAGTTPGNPRRH